MIAAVGKNFQFISLIDGVCWEEPKVTGFPAEFWVQSPLSFTVELIKILT